VAFSLWNGLALIAFGGSVVGSGLLGFAWAGLLVCIWAGVARANTLAQERENLGITIDMYAEIVDYMAVVFAYRDVCVDRKPEMTGKLLEAYAAWGERNGARAEELGKLFWAKVNHLIQIDAEDKMRVKGLTRDVVKAKLINSRNSFRDQLRREAKSKISDTCMQFYDGLTSGQLDLDRRKESEINTLRIFSEVPK
jgi:hypothetical protein